VIISAQERQFLYTSASCPNCHVSWRADIYKILILTGLDGEGAAFWHSYCRKCGRGIMKTEYDVARAHLKLLESDHPDLAQRLKTALSRNP